MTNKQPVLLCILDGFGLNPNIEGNAVALAKKPVIDKLFNSCPNTTLTTFGEEVGLPAGQMGNSEVGHLNIGAGRVIEQWLLRINRALQGIFLDSNPEYNTFLNRLKQNKTLHLIGLFSDGGVHSHIEHLFLLIERLKKDCLNSDKDAEIYLHLITDGRDTAPNAAVNYLKELQDKYKNQNNIKIASIIGRFFAMDRDKRWERVKKATDAMTACIGKKSSDPLTDLLESYKAGITDEFIEPIIVNPKAIGPNDSVLFWNFREDRMRQLTAALFYENFDEYIRGYKPFNKQNVLCFTEYDHNLKLPFIFDILQINNHLGEWLSKNNLTQLRVAETEKYPHVTYFFNGGIEKPYPNEDRHVVPSPRDVKTYDLKPEMSAEGVCQTVINGIESGKYDFIAVNFANCDMVGHTGVLQAGIKAVETVDGCLGRILAVLEKHNGKALIIADHGNAEQMIDYKTGAPHTAHTKYPVPAIIVGFGKVPVTNNSGALSDVAPTILKMLKLAAPPEMTGTSLF